MSVVLGSVCLSYEICHLQPIPCLHNIAVHELLRGVRSQSSALVGDPPRMARDRALSHRLARQAMGIGLEPDMVSLAFNSSCVCVFFVVASLASPNYLVFVRWMPLFAQLLVFTMLLSKN